MSYVLTYWYLERNYYIEKTVEVAEEKDQMAEHPTRTNKMTETEEMMDITRTGMRIGIIIERTNFAGIKINVGMVVSVGTSTQETLF